jgi:hypothetical protein
VSHGEHLCQTAELIESARSATQRDLRLYHLLGALRSAAAPSSDAVTGALGIFARSAQDALANGVASDSLSDLVARLREAGELLRAVAESDDRMLISRRLLDVAHRLDGLSKAGRPEDEPVPIESLGYEPEPAVVPILSLAPDEAVPVASGGLEGSFRTFDLLLRQRGAAAPSLDALVAAPVPATRPAATPPPVLTPEPEPVAIGTLCYRGQAALERANTVRHQIAGELTRDASLESLQPLLQELLDLVPLALEQT